MTRHREIHTLDLKALRELALKATPGPWRAENMETLEDGSPGCAWGIGADNRTVVEHDFVGSADAAFIAAVNPLTVSALLDELVALRAENELQRQFTANAEREFIAAKAELQRVQAEKADALRSYAEVVTMWRDRAQAAELAVLEDRRALTPHSDRSEP